MNLTRFLGSCGTQTLINFAEKHLSLLEHNDNDAFLQMAPRVAKSIQTLRARFNIRRSLAASCSAAMTTKDRMEDALDNEIASLSYELLGPRLLDGDRRHPDYWNLFPGGDIQFIHGPEHEGLAQVSAIISRLEGQPEHPIAYRATVLRIRFDAFREAAAPVVAAKTALQSAEDQEQAARDILTKVLRKNAAIIRAEYMDEAEVEALFPPISRGSRTEETAVSLAV